MLQKNDYRKLLTVCLSSALSVAVCGVPLLAIAQEYHPPKRGIPGRREGAGTRGTCLRGPKLLMPLTPSDSFSATVSNSPTFFWYVPKTGAQTAEFALLDETDRTLYKTTLNLPEAAGVLSFSLPTSVAASILTVGKDYYWQFSILCDPNQPSINPFVEGVVQRVKPATTLTNQLKKASARDRSTIYATNGIWQDAIATLAQARCTNPQDQNLITSWTHLLQSVKLEDYAQEPLTASCPAKPTKK
ncbi:DUF928 domain-containing protein [Stenomitos frigidus]|uniref:DUF928 domain-containing protein n=1 Tax=Stenomitos frigidus ULC18 TaxID=2107698 RepID=A0A2T1DZW4_9CYAN|nr:DUF928 domain-containing protein [Stenomitos frigidus]PSB25999.1 hypothetical protein C7B82_21095 [Stenomitos frigidus ULC18]